MLPNLNSKLVIMIRKLLYFALFTVASLQAQVVISPNPFNMNSGTITFTYGSSANYSLYDPMSNPNLYLYTGLNTDTDATTWEYHDDWNNVASLIPLTWNSTANAYVANFNLATRTYTHESTQTQVTIPNGTSVNNWFFIIRNEAGSSQSVNLSGIDYGFSPSAVLSLSEFNDTEKVFVHKQQLISELPHEAKVAIFGITGQQLCAFQLVPQQKINLEHLEKGNYFAIIEYQNTKKLLKFTTF